jgi:hypothetical protein
MVTTANELLSRLIEECNPWIRDDYGYTYCFFCIQDEPEHDNDCLYVLIENYIQSLLHKTQ